MSTPYSISINKGTQISGNVQSMVFHPLSRQYPCSLPHHNKGVLSGDRPTPPQFFPSQIPPTSEMNTNRRRQFKETSDNSLQTNIPPSSFTDYIYSSNRKIPLSTQVNYVPPIAQSMYTLRRESNAVGKTAYKIGLSPPAPTGTKSYAPNVARSSLRRARSSGYVAPAKKGAVQNPYSRVGGWGACDRFTYGLK